MITTLTASRKFEWDLPLTEKVADVMRAFGITIQRLKQNAINHTCSINLGAGQIVYLTGPSGSGKSVLLKEFFRNFENESKINIDDIPLPGDKTCVDCVDGGFLETLKNLSYAGLTDVFCVLNCPANLSEGQKYRYRIAKAIAGDKQFIFADEFCSQLDRVTAAVISHNLRKFAVKTGKNFILASAHDDLLADLLPEVIVIKHLAGEAEVIYKNS
jgi:ABC-type ATPase with predicted acetyltransferase domain